MALNQKQQQPVQKPWYKSKTIWVNLILAIAVALDTFLVGAKEFMSPEVYAYIFAGVNMVLRVFTSTGIKN